MILWLVLLLGCGGCGDVPGGAQTSQANRATAAKAAMLRVRLHARFVELTPEGVRVRVDNPTDVAVDRAHILLEGRTASGPWQRDAWTGALAPGQRDLELMIPIPDRPTGGIRVTMTQAVPAPEAVSEN